MIIKIVKGCKNYGQKKVLQNINLSFEDGYAYGLVGTNGCGKTQILKAIAGHIKLSSGKVLQDNTEIRKANNYISDAGILIESPVFLSHLTLFENLDLLKNMCENKKSIDLDKWIAYFDIAEFKDTKFKNLSLGTKQKMGVIQAFMHTPHLLILDEPMNALDKVSVEKTKALIREHKKNGLVIMTSHQKGDIEELCEHVYELEV